MDAVWRQTAVPPAIGEENPQVSVSVRPENGRFSLLLLFWRCPSCSRVAMDLQHHPEPQPQLPVQILSQKPVVVFFFFLRTH